MINEKKYTTHLVDRLIALKISRQVRVRLYSDTQICAENDLSHSSEMVSFGAVFESASTSYYLGTTCIF